MEHIHQWNWECAILSAGRFDEVSVRRPKRRFWKRATIVVAVLSLICGGIFMALSGLATFDLSSFRHENVTFSHQGAKISGSLYLPAEQFEGPIALLVHGDGPQDRLSDGGYQPLMNRLLNGGIAVFSWDKPGVGLSEGNWLNQSMEDRAALVISAADAIRAGSWYGNNAIGVIGFSQAGWVLPHVARFTGDMDFYVTVGGAISWREQSAYLGRMRMQQEGQDDAEISRLLERQKWLDERIFGQMLDYEEYRKLVAIEEPSARLMAPDRYQFVQLNYNSDARPLLGHIKAPFLALSGEKDLNVDARNSINTYRAMLATANAENQFKLVPDASHSLLRAEWYNFQLPSHWTTFAIGLFLIQGSNAYATGVLDIMANWILDVSAKDRRDHPITN